MSREYARMRGVMNKLEPVVDQAREQERLAEQAEKRGDHAAAQEHWEYSDRLEARADELRKEMFS